MAELLGDLNDRGLPLSDEKRREGVPEVVRTRLAQPDLDGGGMKVTVAPVVPVVELKPPAIATREQSIVRL